MASTLTKAQLEELRGRLERERARILEVLGSEEVGPVQPDQDTEVEEAAQRETERDRALDVETRERALLAEVDRALAKLDRGDYGIGETTGDPIPYERLAVVPWAREPVDE